MLEIDGSHGEGGGQLCRYAVALAAITGRVVQLRNIRAKRPKPGLMAQHLTALQAVAQLCNGELIGVRRGATEVEFRPGPITAGNYRFDVGTAGSVSLVLQALVPVALHADGPCRLIVVGGTDVRMAPPLEYLRSVFLPWLSRLGAEVRVESVRHGYYPRGGGEVRVLVTPRKELDALSLERPGPLEGIRALAHVAHLPAHIPERMVASAKDALGRFGPVEPRALVLSGDQAVGAGGALTLVAKTENALLGAATVAERGVPAERLGTDAGRALRAELESGATLDVHAADQLLIYLAQAGGRSCFLVRELSLHGETAVWLIEQFLPARFRVEPGDALQRVTVG